MRNDKQSGLLSVIHGEKLSWSKVHPIWRRQLGKQVGLVQYQHDRDLFIKKKNDGDYLVPNIRRGTATTVQASKFECGTIKIIH